MRLYFDSAATSLMLPEVVETLLKSLTEYPGNPSSLHLHGRNAKAAVERARKEIAQFLGASPSEIFFTSGGTEANNTALSGILTSQKIERVISTPIEHPCVLRTIEKQEKKGDFKIIMLTLDEKGRVDPEELRQILGAEGRETLVSIMHANNEIGTMNDLESLARICKTQGAVFHSDTVQTIAHYPIDFTQLGLDMAAASAHKFHGPKGVGFLYVRGGVRIPPLLRGGGQERGMRSSTENVAGIVAMAKAIQLCHDHMEEMAEKTKSVRDYAMSQIRKSFPKCHFNGDPEGPSLYTVLSVTFPYAPELLIHQLDIEGISASGGSACASGAHTGSHVLTAINADTRGSVARFSFGPTNHKSEVDQLIRVLLKILRN